MRTSGRCQATPRSTSNRQIWTSEDAQGTKETATRLPALVGFGPHTCGRSCAKLGPSQPNFGQSQPTSGRRHARSARRLAKSGRTQAKFGWIRRTRLPETGRTLCRSSATLGRTRAMSGPRVWAVCLGPSGLEPKGGPNQFREAPNAREAPRRLSASKAATSPAPASPERAPTNSARPAAAAASAPSSSLEGRLRCRAARHGPGRCGSRDQHKV